MIQDYQVVNPISINKCKMRLKKTLSLKIIDRLLDWEMEDQNQKSCMFITDPVHGSIELTPLQQDLIQTVEVQRLNLIHQLGMTFHVYPGAHSMRFAHALGVSYLARRLYENLNKQEDSVRASADSGPKISRLISAAGLLHDVGHTPWSHTLEPLLLDSIGINHMELTRQIITGRKTMPIKGAGYIPEILADHDVDPEKAADLICQSYRGEKYIQQIIFGEVDVDMLDYLGRDFHSTGVSFGHIDIERLLQIMQIHSGRIAFKDKGLPAVRDFLNARIEMYSAVYLHKKTRITDLMFLRAAKNSIVRCNEFPEFWCMTDDEILSLILNHSASDVARDLSWRIKYRQDLFKRAYLLRAGRMLAEEKRAYQLICAWINEGYPVVETIEKMLAEKLGITHDYVIADLVVAATDLSEQRFKELDILFIDKNNTTFTLQQLDPVFSEYASRAKPSPALFSVYTPESCAERCPAYIPEIIDWIAKKWN